MKTITIYELLGMVKNDKAPKKIKYDSRLYEFNDKKDNYYENETCSINWDYVSLHCLNDTVEILEEEKKIPENINLAYVEGNLKGKVIEEIPQFEGTLEQLNNLCNIKSKGE